MASGLATRCTACGTTFRVVPDQLRVSGGYVRCGRCSEVFNALEELVDLETGERPGGLAPEAGGATLEGESPAPPAEAEMDYAQAAPRPPAPAAGEPDMAPLDDLRADPRDPATTQAPESSTLAPDELTGPDPAAGDAPSFVVNANRAARWRSPRMRWLLGSACLLALLLLLGQVGYEYRDLVAARYPWARPAMEQACGALGCRVEAARSIDSLSVESSGLVRVERSSLYKLQVALRNRANLELAVPALDVTLTDTQGRIIARRAFKLAELGVLRATIAPGQELSVQGTLQAQGEAAAQPFAGYTIELFYP